MDPVPLEAVRDRAQAVALLDPLRRQILEQAQQPIGAAAMAQRLGLPRQRVNYHVRALADLGLLRPAGTRRKRNLLERRFVATARSYVLSPSVLGGVAPDPRHVTDPLSAAHLLSLAASMQDDVSTAAQQAQAEGKRLSTLSVHTEFRLRSAAQRAAFTRALRDAIVEVIGRFTEPAEVPEHEAPGRPYRLTLGCYPVPKPAEGTKP